MRMSLTSKVSGKSCRRSIVVAGSLALGLFWTGTVSAQQAPLLGVRFSPPSFETELPPAFGGKPNWIWHWMIETDKGWPALNGDNPADSHIAEAARRTDANPSRRALISHPGIPSGVGATRRGCATGAYATHYAKFGRAMANAGLDNAILRIGWEWDGGGTPISLRKDFAGIADYKACFRNIVTNVRAGWRGVRGSLTGVPLFDFNSTTDIGNPSLAGRLDQAYPGNDVVDIVSVEGYDNRPCADATNVDCRWGNIERSLILVRDFAASRTPTPKRMAIPEWAIWNDPTGPAKGFDNPEHVRRLCAFARTPANNVFYYNYFNGGPNYPNLDLTLPRNSQSRNAFVASCGSGPA